MKKIITKINNCITMDWEDVWLIGHDEHSNTIILKTIYGATHTINCDKCATADELYANLSKTFEEAKNEMECSR